MVQLQDFFILLMIAVIVNGDCHLSLRDDFGQPAPVFLRGGDFLTPDESGQVTLRRSETVLVACPGDNKRVVIANQTSSYDVLEAHCIINSTFRVDRWIGQFHDIKCNARPWVSSEEVGQCEDGNTLHRVGYKVKNVFHALYEACFNADVAHTLYVKHELTPINVFAQTDGNSRPNFIEGGMFESVNMADLYRVKNQQERVRQIVGDYAEKYISSTEYLTRGHLAARADFSLRGDQRASFLYVNSAPQWKTSNSGPWAALEDGVRRRVAVLGRAVTVYTGSFGVSLLQNQPFYLASDENNNGIVPVPMYFYKLIYDETTHSAIAFISINRSGLNTTSSPDCLCDSVCEQYSWLRWKGDNNECCSYEEISAMVALPKLRVDGLMRF